MGQGPAARFRCKARATPAVIAGTVAGNCGPTRAIAAQPRIDASAMTLDARHRSGDPHHAGADQAGLPVFPRPSSIVPPTPGRVSIGVPIDMPFTDINKIMEAQFAGRTFPEGRFGVRSTSPSSGAVVLGRRATGC